MGREAGLGCRVCYKNSLKNTAVWLQAGVVSHIKAPIYAPIIAFVRKHEVTNVACFFPSSKALVPSSFLLLLVRPLFLVASCYY